MSATLSGLTPGTTYHFRAEAFNSLGTTYGADQTFTTSSCKAEPDRDRGFEVALAHFPKRTAAARARRRAARVLHVKPVIERDGCPDYEAAVAGLSRKSAKKLLRRAKKLHYRKAVVEKT